MGMKNHQYVPAKLINSIANLKTGDTYKIIKRLLKLKFINHVSIKYDGYKLNYSGYDYLALQTFVKRGTITQVVGKLGVGKESDIYTCYDAEGKPVVLKFARLGRTSFMTVKNNRDYIGGRTSYNWLYLSRISSTK
jgi:RIO kinase 2